MTLIVHTFLSSLSARFLNIRQEIQKLETSASAMTFPLSPLLLFIVE